MMNTKRLKLVTVNFLFLALMQWVPLAAGQELSGVQKSQREGNMSKNDSRESPLACNANALSAAQRSRLRALLTEFRGAAQGIKELPNGYAVRLSKEGSLIRDVAEFITLERLCCQFFDFGLEAEAEGGYIWLSLAGREGVKEFAKIEFAVNRPDMPADTASAKESPLVCNDAALTAAQWERLGALLTGFRSAKQGVKELPNGYAVQLPCEASTIVDVAEFMTLVRTCSPYLATTLEVGREDGPIWFKVTGRAGVKEQVRSEFRLNE
jgi:hypothetical protein